jgi:adenosylcobinamide hydrolase
VLRLHRPETDWLSTGWQGGRSTGPAAYNVTVPTGWDCESIEPDVTDRLDSAGFPVDGPVLLTGVSQSHARGARRGPVVACATVGLSNPATLPLDPAGTPSDLDRTTAGTCNLFVGTTRALADGALANLATVATEAKTATLLALVGFTGTTSDAVVVASDPAGEPATYSGTATAIGDATRACVREAITASLHSRYDDEMPPGTVEEATHGVVTTTIAEGFEP